MTHPELPQDVDAETATLGALLLNRDAIIAVAPWLRPEQFYYERNACIYAAVLRLYAQKVPPDIRTVASELRARGQLEDVGGIPYLSQLLDETPTSYHVEYYARRVWATAILRALITAGGKIAAIGYQQPDPERALAEAQAALTTINLNGATSPLVGLDVLVDREYERLQAALNHDQRAIGVLTGFTDLDALLGGLRDDDLILLGGRPSMGKTAILLGLADGIAKLDGTNERDSLIFSLEMSKDQLVQRYMAMRSGVDSTRIRSMDLDEQDAERVMNALGQLGTLPIWIDDTPGVTVNHIRTVAHRHMAARGRKLVLFIDYTQLMTAGTTFGNRVQEISEISRGLKGLAKELHCPVVALCQLSRDVERREDKTPLLSDLRESGSLEQDADIVLFLYRDEVYHDDTDRPGIADLIIAKDRNGPLGVVELCWHAPTTSFKNLTHRH